MIADAVDTAFTVFAAAVMWVAIAGGLTAALAVALFAWFKPRITRSRTWRRLAHRRASRSRTAPWTHTQPITYEEAA